MRKSYWLFMFTFALVFYVLGAAFLEGFVNYRTWHLIGAAEFQAYHRALTPRVVGAPGFLVIVLTVLLLWWRPAAVPRWAIWLSLALHLVTVFALPWAWKGLGQRAMVFVVLIWLLTNALQLRRHTIAASDSNYIG